MPDTEPDDRPRLAETRPVGASLALQHPAVGWWSWVIAVTDRFGIAQPYLLLCWLIGVFALSARLVVGLFVIQRLRRRKQRLPDEFLAVVRRLSQRLGFRRCPQVATSGGIGEALAAGFLRPLVLLPASWLVELPPDVLEAVLAHEMAHLRRWDLWVNLVQRVVEALLFYQPAVWWLTGRLRTERELCCDELAVCATGQRIVYARALEYVARQKLAARRPLFANGIGGKKMALLNRVRHVLGLHQSERRFDWWMAGLLAAAVPLMLWATTAAFRPALADDQDDPPAVTSDEDVASDDDDQPQRPERASDGKGASDEEPARDRNRDRGRDRDWYERLKRIQLLNREIERLQKEVLIEGLMDNSIEQLMKEGDREKLVKLIVRLRRQIEELRRQISAPRKDLIEELRGEIKALRRQMSRQRPGRALSLAQQELSRKQQQLLRTLPRLEKVPRLEVEYQKVPRLESERRDRDRPAARRGRGRERRSRSRQVPPNSLPGVGQRSSAEGRDGDRPRAEGRNADWPRRGYGPREIGPGPFGPEIMKLLQQIRREVEQIRRDEEKLRHDFDKLYFTVEGEPPPIRDVDKALEKRRSDRKKADTDDVRKNIDRPKPETIPEASDRPKPGRDADAAK